MKGIAIGGLILMLAGILTSGLRGEIEIGEYFYKVGAMCALGAIALKIFIG